MDGGEKKTHKKEVISIKNKQKTLHYNDIKENEPKRSMKKKKVPKWVMYLSIVLIVAAPLQIFFHLLHQDIILSGIILHTTPLSVYLFFIGLAGLFYFMESR